MGINYLMNRPWSSWTRDERFFCSVLHACAFPDPAGFAAWVVKTAGLEIDCHGDWELGYEVCFYRDFLWHMRGPTARQAGLPAKRTFDLCLFGDRDIVIIEAKVCETFSGDQNKEFSQDKAHIKSIPELSDIRVHLVALASAQYFANAAKYGRSETLEMFDGRIHWSDAAQKYGNRLLDQASRMYGMAPGEMLRDRD